MTENESFRPEGEPYRPVPPEQASPHAPTEPQPAVGAPGPPPWGEPGPHTYAVPQPQPPKTNRVGKAVAVGAAAVALSLASGGIGAAAVLGLNQTGVVRVTETREAAPVIDRASLATIAANVQPSVVSVKTGSGEGSGVVLSGDGYILTNNHVVATARNNSLTVTFSDGKTAKATIVGTDPKTDLAVVKADGVSGLTAATFGDSSSMRVGDTVLALGSPLGLEGSVTAGIVSAVDRTIQVGGEESGSPFDRSSSSVTSISGVLQTDAAINPGNSGGALVNLDGDVIGINTAIATSGTSNGNIGVGFAIPGNRAKQVADQLRAGQKVSHAFLGVQVTPAESGGAQVTTVTSGGPAASAGLQQGDVITKVGGTTINDSDDLVSAVQSRRPGDRLEITFIRDAAEKTTTATLGEAS
jgi:putative serine protease PepD